MNETVFISERELGVDPWQTREEDFPSLGPAASKLRFLLQYAVLAPSSHNSQPWRFRVADDHVDIFADRTRALPVVDPDDRALTISCGVAIEFLRIALCRFGYRDRTAWLPNPHEPDFLARVQMAEAHRTTEPTRRLFRAIPARRTNRQRFQERSLPGALLATFVMEAELAGAYLEVEQDLRAKAKIAALIAEGDRIQLRDPAFRRELASWLHVGLNRAQDGIPESAFGSGPWHEILGTPAIALVVRTFSLGRGRAATDRALAQGSPALATLWTAGDTPFHWLVAGQALARVLLTAQAAGVSASYLNQPIEVPALRPRLAQLLGIAGYPQILLRLGIGPPLDPTPRRPVEETMR